MFELSALPARWHACIKMVEVLLLPWGYLGHQHHISQAASQQHHTMH